MKFYLAAAAFVAAIVTANWLTTTQGMIPVGLGLTATAGTYAAGLTFIVRDTIQDAGGKRAVVALILAGAALSFILGPDVRRIALASGLAFLLSELADLAVYTPLRGRGYLRAAIASNVVGSVVDTILFLWIAGFPIWSQVPGQLLAKLTVTGILVVLVMGTRAVLRQPSRA